MSLTQHEPSRPLVREVNQDGIPDCAQMSISKPVQSTPSIAQGGVGHEVAAKQPRDEDPPIVIKTADFPGLVDLVEQDGRPAFLINEGDNLNVKDRVEIGGLVLMPPSLSQIPWLLPRGDRVLQAAKANEPDRALFDALVAYHRSISELPGDAYYELMAAWVMHTYLLESVQYSPIICHFAVPERGKSRTGKGMIFAAYRGIHVESLREAYIIRVAHSFQGAIFFDVLDLWGKARHAKSEDIILHRFEKGAKVPRVLYPDRGPFEDIVYYEVFGPTIVATNEPVHQALDSRAIQVNMPHTTRRYESEVTPELALPLKERLVVFRARHMGTALPACLKPACGRLGDILKPLLQIILLVKPEIAGNFQKLVRQIEQARRLEKAETLEARILRTVVALEDQVARGALSLKEIVEALNAGRPERFHLTAKRVASLLKAMGLKLMRGDRGEAVIIWDEVTIGRLLRAYGVEPSSESSESPEP